MKKNKTLKILVVDDDPDFRQPIASILQSEGNEVKDVSDGSQAVETIQKEDIDVAIVDYMLPRQTGLEIAKKITKSKKGKFTKIIMVSSHEGIKPLAEQCGVDAFLTKPLNPEDLLKVLDSLV